MNLIAIDPGKSGGIAFSTEPGGIPCGAATPMPDTDGDLIDLLHSKMAYGYHVCIIEEVGGYVGGKGQPGSAMFTFGRNFGFLLGVLQTLGYKVILVRPQKWQKHFSLGKSKDCTSKNAWKNKLKAEAERRFPQLKVTKATADALLILEYGLATIGKPEHD